MHESFTPEERAVLERYVTNVDGSVFVLKNLPEVVKGALFARYSRSAKSLKRLLLDEFLSKEGAAETKEIDAGAERGEKLYDKVFIEYGDDSVAQLGGVHIACEGASNILTKVLEWGRLAAYLEQSTRYVPYTDRPNGRWKYHVPAELEGRLRERYVEAMDDAFETYASLIEPLSDHFAKENPKPEGASDRAYRSSVRAKALDALRGLLPASTQSNVGVYATGQAYEMMLLRMRAAPEQEVRDYADAMLVELRKVIPAFMKRVDQENRGVVWTNYLKQTRAAIASAADTMLDAEPADVAEVELTEFDPDGEIKVVASALYASSRLPDRQLLEIARKMSKAEREAVLVAYVGERRNRRHKPGRAFERTSYRFDVLSDYGAFRDLQRHRLLTLEWQPLCPHHGYVMGEAIAAAGAEGDFARVMQRGRDVYDAIFEAGLEHAAPYAVPMAYRVRYYLHMNAREAMHMLELRTAPQGHASYRRVCQAMHRLLVEEAKHEAIAGAMKYVNHEAVALERLAAEVAADARKT